MSENFSISIEEIQTWIERNRTQWLEEYCEFLSFPSISSDFKYMQSMIDCQEWLSEYLVKLGFTVEIWKTNGHPIIFANYSRVGDEKPTLLIYHHYDVQPVDPLEEWISPPFSPLLREGAVYARGAQDNKGQCFYVLQALKCIMEHSQSYPLNIKLCIEGEEEVGSTGLSQILLEKKEQLKADYLAIVDSGIQNPKIPSLTLGMRGIITLDVEVKGSEIDLHSGQHGGIVPNPIHMLVQLLAKLRNEEGKVMIPGFYEGVETLSSEKLEALSFNFDEQEYYKQTGAFCVGGERGYSPLQRAHIRPTVEINGIQGGYTGQGFKTVIPAVAKAKISCRLVPQQDPTRISELITSYLTVNAPFGVKVSVDVHQGKGKPIRISADSRVVKAFSKALEEVFGKTCQYSYAGGSIPIVSELTDACGGEVVILGLGLNTDQIHAPNEHFSLDRIEKGIAMIARAIDNMSKIDQ